MNKKIAISILKDQIKKSKSLDSLDDKYHWILQTTSHIQRIFGNDSLEYKFMVEYNPSIGHEINLTSYLNNCIDTILHTGLYKPNSIWKRLDNMNQSLLWSIITFLIALIFYAGVLFEKIDNSSKNNQNINKPVSTISSSFILLTTIESNSKT